MIDRQEARSDVARPYFTPNLVLQIPEGLLNVFVQLVEVRSRWETTTLEVVELSKCSAGGQTCSLIGSAVTHDPSVNFTQHIDSYKADQKTRSSRHHCSINKKIIILVV
jgi:hypothetical protein